jgi:hypothetical protein
MSDTTNDTSAIDEKKLEENSSNSSKSFTSNIRSFITSLITFILIILLYFSSSSLILFVCKLAQSNILPTDQECFPYTNSKPTIQQIKTNIFTTFTEPEMSVKLEFPYDKYNSSNKILDIFRDYKNKPSSNFLANYFIAIIEQLIGFNYSTINTLMNTLNSAPEALIIGLGPLITGFLFAIMMVVNLLYIIYLWFSNMAWFFKKNTNDTNEGVPKWEDVTFTTPVDFGYGVGLVILFIILFFVGFGFISIVPFVLLCYCCLTAIMYKSIIGNKKTNAFTIIKDVLKYYKITIVSLISIAAILLSFSKLGTIPGIFSIITLALIYWGIISIDIFKPISEENLTPIVSYEQAAKKCSGVNLKKEKHGFLYDLLLGQKGGGITKELKKIGKNLTTK